MNYYTRKQSDFYRNTPRITHYHRLIFIFTTLIFITTSNTIHSYSKTPTYSPNKALINIYDFETDVDISYWREQGAIQRTNERAYSGSFASKLVSSVQHGQSTNFFFHWDNAFIAEQVKVRVYWPDESEAEIIWAQVCVDVENGCFDLPQINRGNWNTYTLNLAERLGGMPQQPLNQVQVPGLLIQGAMQRIDGLSTTSIPIYVDTIEIFLTPITTTETFLPMITASQPAKLLFGIGPQADSARELRISTEARIQMFTSWYNGTEDLTWITKWKQDLVPQTYAKNIALHLIVFTDQAEDEFLTNYGIACGRRYPMSDLFLDDMKKLAITFAGSTDDPPLYVTLFTEFQTYGCIDNAWNPSPEVNNYFLALKDSYREAKSIFHQYAPNAKVSLGWGGWQMRWDDQGIGGGRSMFQYFSDVMLESDFQSFQAMQQDSNFTDVILMTQTLSAYGPVMLAHYKPDDGSQATFDRDTQSMLNDDYLNNITSAGLFAWSFMDNSNLSASEESFQFTKNAINRHAYSQLPRQ